MAISSKFADCYLKSTGLPRHPFGVPRNDVVIWWPVASIQLPDKFQFEVDCRQHCGNRYFGIVMVSTMRSSVSRRSEMAEIPDDWIFANDWLRLFRNAPTLTRWGFFCRPSSSS